MKTMTLAEIRETLNSQGVPSEHRAFKCPMCHTVQSSADFVAAGVGPDYDSVKRKVGYGCIGIFTGAGSPSQSTPGQGCNWTLGGALKMHTLEIIDDEGGRHATFEPATAEEAQAHYRKLVGQQA